MKENSNEKIAEKILEFTKLEKKRVLEIGCGRGRITFLIHGNSGKFIAIDPDDKSIEEARKNVPSAQFFVGSGEKLEFPDNSFDIVIFTLSLHHQNSKIALMEAVKVLDDNGIILVIEPVNSGELEEVFSLVFDETEEIIQAQQAIEESGLKIIKSDCFSGEWIFEDRNELCQSLFDFYSLPFDEEIISPLDEILGEKSGMSPIVLEDEMVIYLMKK